MATPPSIPGTGAGVQADFTALNNYVQPTLGHGLRIWWAFYWRNTIASLAVMFLLGMLMQFFSVPYRERLYVVKYGQYVVSYVMAVFIIHHIVRKNFRDFRIALLETGSETPQPLKLTRRRTVRIWWTYTWRTVLYLAILSVAINVPLGFIGGAVEVIFPKLAQAFSFLVGLVMGAAVGLFAIYSNILDEEFPGFTVTLVPREVVPSANAVALAPTSETTTP
jgi:hypothetical protein